MSSQCLTSGLYIGSLFLSELIDKDIMANIKTKQGLVIEGLSHAEKSIKRRNRLPRLSGRLQNKSRDADNHAALFVEVLLLHFTEN